MWFCLVPKQMLIRFFMNIDFRGKFSKIPATETVRILLNVYALNTKPYDYYTVWHGVSWVSEKNLFLTMEFFYF